MRFEVSPQSGHPPTNRNGKIEVESGRSSSCPVFPPNNPVAPVADDGRHVGNAKLEPKLIVPKRFAAGGHSAKNEAAVVSLIGFNYIPTHRVTAYRDGDATIPFVGGLEANRVTTVAAIECQIKRRGNSGSHCVQSWAGSGMSASGLFTDQRQ